MIEGGLCSSQFSTGVSPIQLFYRLQPDSSIFTVAVCFCAGSCYYPQTLPFHVDSAKVEDSKDVEIRAYGWSFGHKPLTLNPKSQVGLRGA